MSILRFAFEPGKEVLKAAGNELTERRNIIEGRDL